MSNVKISVTPMTAKLLHDTVLIGKMSPYVKVNLNPHKAITTPAKRYGSIPSWSDIFVMDWNPQEANVITFEIWDKHRIRKDKYIATGTFNMGKISPSKPVFFDWIPIYNEGSYAGKLLIEVKYYEDED
jgi:Ca2+-dependent lipid-binding protein, contains C2 domain